MKYIYNNNKTIIFGLAIACSFSKKDYRILFKSFFDLVGGKPECIITDQDAAIFKIKDRPRSLEAKIVEIVGQSDFRNRTKEEKAWHQQIKQKFHNKQSQKETF